ncbi:hypothetical protein SK34_00704 [Citrobacter sp. MGH104]|nr:hypothetical protein SK34_00704 [Citrobacter sp. MGH104]
MLPVSISLKLSSICESFHRILFLQCLALRIAFHFLYFVINGLP